MVTTWWSPQLNALLGSLVVAAGAWLAWDSFSPWGVFLVAGGVAGFLIWQGRTIGLVWAWATLLLGLESLAWPIVTMVQVRSTTTEPTDEQMGTILSAVLTGLLSAVFWITFLLWALQASRPAHRRLINRCNRQPSTCAAIRTPPQTQVRPTTSRSDRRRHRT